ncbi:MAG: hypothetical protein OEY13_05185 [Gammaproteobacteria bacterium]|nr:hypothetical protein [Gammaproteobacteria bacterium]MDH4312089.1 hypothetical protein [Gammaproteobacteria bacterium]MDH5272452.1 hypothetical protein [Gammaproteobacteria bacterium]
MPKRRRTQARSKRTLLFVAMAAGGVAAAADAPPLSEDFLEYLGSWAADEADWLVANAAIASSAPAASGMDSRPPNPTTIEKRGAVPSPATTERKP